MMIVSPIIVHPVQVTTLTCRMSVMKIVWIDAIMQRIPSFSDHSQFRMSWLNGLAKAWYANIYFMRQTYYSGEENKRVALHLWIVDSDNEEGDKDQSSEEEHRVVLDQVPLFVGFEVSVHGSESLKVSRMSVFDGFSFIIEKCKGHQRKKNAQQNSEYGEGE
jgi:hypothetical protein